MIQKTSTPFSMLLVWKTSSDEIGVEPLSDSRWSDPLLYTTENLMHHDTVICLFRNKEVVNSHSETHREWRILLMKKAISNGRCGSCWFVLRCAFVWKQLRFLDEACKTFHKCVYLLFAYISAYCVSSKNSSMNEASSREKKRWSHCAPFNRKKILLIIYICCLVIFYICLLGILYIG